MEERSKSVLSEPSYTNRRVTRQKNSLTALIDWCQITVKDVDLFTVITDILKIPLSLMELQNKGKGIAGHCRGYADRGRGTLQGRFRSP